MIWSPWTRRQCPCAPVIGPVRAPLSAPDDQCTVLLCICCFSEEPCSAAVDAERGGGGDVGPGASAEVHAALHVPGDRLVRSLEGTTTDEALYLSYSLDRCGLGPAQCKGPKDHAGTGLWKGRWMCVVRPLLQDQ